MDRYDWGRACRGFWAGKLRIGEPEQRRILDADLVEAFPDSKSVNDAFASRGEGREGREREAAADGGVTLGC